MLVDLHNFSFLCLFSITLLDFVMFNFVAICKGISANPGTSDEPKNYQATTTETLSKIHLVQLSTFLYLNSLLESHAVQLSKKIEAIIEFSKIPQQKKLPAKISQPRKFYFNMYDKGKQTSRQQ